MRQFLIVQFHPDRRLEFPLRADEAAMPSAEARHWLDEQFVANDCEPLRASGKVLTADKVVAVAHAAGERRFADDAAWAHSFARAALSALGRPMVTVDVAAGAITF
jgi:hypothetical protein